jgi:AraC family transcriptional regulator, regulatory protein of adaptative response / methylated-DNA-[protein]-cysteine methyltransferase
VEGHPVIRLEPARHARRLGQALGAIQRGERVSSAAFGAGYDSLAGFNEAIQRFAGRAPSRLAEAPVVTVGRLETLLGPMIAGATAEHLVLLQFADRRMLSTLLARLARALGCVFAPGGSPLLAELAAQLGAYFRGERMVFDVPLLTPGSLFQEQVWRALCEIPPAATRSYGELARIVGRPGAIRAVARANGDNPISILIPCHRVVGADGRLVGYGGGLWRKQRLLTLEGGGARIEATGPLEHLAARISRQP